jgi:hypothetical protein
MDGQAMPGSWVAKVERLVAKLGRLVAKSRR